MFVSLVTFLATIGLAVADCRTYAPEGALVVGGKGQYKTVGAAVAALSKTSGTAQSIFINPGSYHEQVYIPKLASSLSIYGYTEDDSSYKDNKVTITQDRGADLNLTDDETATMRVWTTNFKLYNVNLVNTRGEGTQALALSASAGDQGYYGCQFLGYQDTVLSETGNQLFARSLIQGATDFIFGQHATAWFSQNDIRVVTASYGTITASGRDSVSDPSWYVLDQCNIAAASGNNVPAGAYYLGRPWRPYARVTVQNTYMTSVINAAGWSVWETNNPQTSNVTYQEYDNTGPGSKGPRASFSSEIQTPVRITQILGDDYETAAYVDMSYLPCDDKDSH